MSKYFVSAVVEFEEVFDNDGSIWVISAVRRGGVNEPQDPAFNLDSFHEGVVQSDWGNIEFPSALNDALFQGKATEFNA